MPDLKKNSSIFNFSRSQIRFLLVCGIFFIPIIVLYALVEKKVSEIPNRFSIIRDYMNDEGNHIETAIFGSSQIQNGINPEYLSKPAINLASLGQHHNTDFNLLKGLIDRFPNLKTVVFEVSYGHFEIPHNSKYYWKNSLFLKYYHVNTFDRTVTPKDSLLFISHPGKFSEELTNYYFKDSPLTSYNKYGFETNHFEGKFKKLQYDSAAIKKKPIKIYKRENLETFNYNTAYFYDMITYCFEHNLNVVILSPPTQSNYNALRNPSILSRRDSILQHIHNTYPLIYFLNLEENPEFTLRDFRNENHLNSNGATKLTKKLDSLLITIHE